MKFYTQYSKDNARPTARKGKGSKTKQQFKAECDMNNILAKTLKTGQLPDLIKKNPQYGDFSKSLDFQDSMNLVAHANEQFAALPAKVRARFGNDPASFLEFAEDAQNGAEMIKMGLATATPIEPPKNATKSQPEASGKKNKGASPPQDKPADESQ